MYDKLRKDIKSTTLKISEADKLDFTEWNDFRKSNFGYLTLSTTSGISVDSFYKELSSEYPGMFDEDIHITVGDQLREMVDVLAKLKPKEYELTDEEYAETLEDVTTDILSQTIELANDMGYIDTVDEVEVSTVGYNVDFWDKWFTKAEEYGIIPKGENPTRDIDVPKKITKDKLVSQFARTMLEAGVTPDTAVSEFEKRVLDGTMTHEVVTNNSAREWAVNQIKYHGFEEALNTWSVYTRDGNVGKKELALGMELYNQCITNGDVTNAMKIAAELVAEGTRTGRCNGKKSIC